jgi:hypothetical protein
MLPAAWEVKMRLLYCLVVLISILSVSPAVVAQDACVVGGAEMASCSPDARVFESVLIAIPGWTGVCETSLGEGERNLLNTIRKVSFFDVDCFDYDSHGTSFEAIRDQLWARIGTSMPRGTRSLPSSPIVPAGSSPPT